MCDQTSDSFQNELSYKSRHLHHDDDFAYRHCFKILENDFESEQSVYTKQRKKITARMHLINEQMTMLKSQKMQKIKAKSKIQQKISKSLQEMNHMSEEKTKKQIIKQKIASYNSTIQSCLNRIQQLKQQSYQIKSNYLQLQDRQAQINQKFAQLIENQQIYSEFKKRQQQYKNYSQKKNQIEQKHNKNHKKISAYLRDKIQGMAALRTHITSIDEKLDSYNNRIKEQEYVINGLKVKTQKYSKIDDQLFRHYQSQYQQRYLSNRRQKTQNQDKESQKYTSPIRKITVYNNTDSYRSKISNSALVSNNIFDQKSQSKTNYYPQLIEIQTQSKKERKSHRRLKTQSFPIKKYNQIQYKQRTNLPKIDEFKLKIKQQKKKSIQRDRQNHLKQIASQMDESKNISIDYSSDYEIIEEKSHIK